MKLFKLSLLLTILFTLCAAAHAEVVGRVLIAAGDTSVIRNNQELHIAVGSPVEEQDTLKTGPASNMQVRFTDESVVSLRDQSLLKIDEYKFTGKQDGMEKALFNLVKGGFRTITGLIGKVNKTNYGVKTATATIGIRGTHFALLHCTAGDCGVAAKDGLYGGVSGGIIAAINNTGEYQFGSGDYFFIPSEDEPAQKLIGPPGFLADHLTGQGRVEGRQVAFDRNERSENGGYASDSRPNSLIQPPPQQPFIVTENLCTNGAPCVLSLNAVLSLNNDKAAAFAYTDLDPVGFNEVGSGSTSNVVVDSSGRLIAYDLSPSSAKSINMGSFAEFSTPDPTAGNLTVARWTGATVVDSKGVTALMHTPLGGVHTVAADFATSFPPIGTGSSVTFSMLIAATTPTDANGVPGSFGSASVRVDFVSRQVDITSLIFTVTSVTYSLNSSLPGQAGSFSPSAPYGSGTLGGTCTGGVACAADPTASGKFAFILAGPTTVSGVGVSYTALAPAVGVPVAGAFAVK